jgi:hypothetical protein
MGMLRGGIAGGFLLGVGYGVITYMTVKLSLLQAVEARALDGKS